MFAPKTAYSIIAASLLAMLGLSFCAKTKTGEEEKKPAFASTYAPEASGTILIKNAHVLDGIGGEFERADILIENGKISKIGDFDAGLAELAKTIDAKGRWVTPGVIDIHSHLGVYATPGVRAHSDGNDATSPITAEVYAEHGIWPQDPDRQQESQLTQARET